MFDCPKCASQYSCHGPHYNKVTDTLDYWCRVCGYVLSKPPRDQERSPDDD